MAKVETGKVQKKRSSPAERIAKTSLNVARQFLSLASADLREGNTQGAKDKVKQARQYIATFDAAFGA